MFSQSLDSSGSWPGPLSDVLFQGGFVPTFSRTASEAPTIQALAGLVEGVAPEAFRAFVSSLHHSKSDVFAPDALLRNLWACGPWAYIDQRPALAAVVCPATPGGLRQVGL